MQFFFISFTFTKRKSNVVNSLLFMQHWNRFIIKIILFIFCFSMSVNIFILAKQLNNNNKWFYIVIYKESELKWGCKWIKDQIEVDEGENKRGKFYWYQTSNEILNEKYMKLKVCEG